MIDQRIDVRESTGVGEARRLAAELARDAGFNSTDSGRLALIVTEAASNLIKHARGGEILLRMFDDDVRGRGVDVVALDRGPGITNLPAALRDGFSSAGTLGNGLGAIARLASSFDIYSRSESGTVLFARVSSAGAPRDSGFAFGAINVPFPGETVSGDCWAVRPSADRMLVLVADGLGHGSAASQASGAAAASFYAHAAAAPGEVLEEIHRALRPTRGAAVAVAAIDRANRRIVFAGLGNIAGTILSNGSTRSVVSHHGTAGHDVRRIHEFTYEWPPQALFVLHSDGLTSHWTFDAYPGVQERHPMLIAALLYRDCRRARDDATVVVVREAQ